MNAKTAKKLRRIANVVIAEAQQKTKNADQIKDVAYSANRAGTIIVDPKTTKGVYNTLKKNLKAGVVL